MERPLVIALNPSSAGPPGDEDNSTTKLIGFCERWGVVPNGAGGVRFSACGRYRHKLWRAHYTLINLFNWISTKPEGMLAAHRAGYVLSSVENDTVLRAEAKAAETVIVAWGGPHGTKALQKLIAARVELALAILKEVGAKPLCLGVTKDGHPRHPLMLAYSTQLQPWSQT